MLIAIVSLIAFIAAALMTSKFYSIMNAIEAQVENRLTKFMDDQLKDLEKKYSFLLESFELGARTCHYRQDELIQIMKSEMAYIKQVLLEIRAVSDQRHELELELQKYKAILGRKEKKNGKI